MKTAAFMAAVALATGAVDVVGAEGAGRFRPAASNLVVLRVPARAASDPIALLEQQRAREPRNQAVAAELAERYVELARAERQPRYFARAEALLQPWMKRPDVGAATLRVQADILQNRHEFAEALKLLDRAIATAPRDSGARLMRASVKLVQGRAVEARTDCAALLSAGESAVGTVCLAQVLGATGSLDRADALLKTVLQGGPDSERPMSPSTRAWALGLLADFADRASKPSEAEGILRKALALLPGDEGLRTALSDLLLARGAHREALAVVDGPTPSIGLLARRAQAQRLLRDPAYTDTREQIRNLIDLSSRRGDRPHLREEALIALVLDDDASRALELAKLNFETQRETLDARLLARAAQACADRTTLTTLTHWLSKTGYEDAQLRQASELSKTREVGKARKVSELREARAT
jgi:tetratricopeptide (TPR) repeat protein